MSYNNSGQLLNKPLADDDANKEIKKMISFILQEASEKASEIKLRAEEEFNMEKAKIYRNEKLSIEESHFKKLKSSIMHYKV